MPLPSGDECQNGLGLPKVNNSVLFSQPYPTQYKGSCAGFEVVSGRLDLVSELPLDLGVDIPLS